MWDAGGWSVAWCGTGNEISGFGGLDLIGKAAVLKTAAGNRFGVRVPGPPPPYSTVYHTIFGPALLGPIFALGTGGYPPTQRSYCQANFQGRERCQAHCTDAATRFRSFASSTARCLGYCNG